MVGALPRFCGINGDKDVGVACGNPVIGVAVGTT